MIPIKSLLGNKNVLIVAGIVVLLVVAGYAGLLPLQFAADTDTEAYYAYSNSDTPTYGLDNTEFCDEVDIVTSWKQSANSVKLTFDGHMYINECSWAGTRSETPQYYYYVVSIDEGNGWDVVFDYEDYDRDLIHIATPTSGHPGQLLEFSEVSYYNDYWNTLGGGAYPFYDYEGNHAFSTHRGGPLDCEKIWPNLDAYSIELIGPHVGKLKVELWGVFDCDWNDPGLYSRRLLKDEVNLLSGAGSVEIDTSTTVFEEGETVPIVVDTGFSGKAMGTDQGWELRVYEPGSGQAIATYPIPDDRAGYEIDFTVPNGAYNANGDNMWTIKLWNTLFNQAEEDFFAVGEGMSDDGPSRPTVSFDKMSYEKGDEVVVTLESEPNPDGNDEVYEFYVKAYYGNSEVNSVSSALPGYVQAQGQQAQISFIANRADVYVTVEATAFDAPHGQGGLPSETREVTVYLQDADPNPDDDVFGIDLADVIIIVLLVSVFSILGVFIPAPIAIRVLLVIIGIALAVLYWAFATGALMSWMGG